VPKKKTIVLTIIIVTAALAVFSFESFSINEIIAEKIAEDWGYSFAEDVSVTGEFSFFKGDAVYQFEAFTQKSGFKIREDYVFSLGKIVGDTPLLHHAADLSYEFKNSPKVLDNVASFDVKIILSQGSEIKRAYSYTDCLVSDSIVQTAFDLEEGWFNKHFSVIDNFEIECGSMIPQNPAYDEIASVKEKSKTESSMDYQARQRNLGQQ
jgi:hypothetical protein